MRKKVKVPANAHGPTDPDTHGLAQFNRTALKE
jgi:hypothetical protein